MVTMWSLRAPASVCLSLCVYIIMYMGLMCVCAALAKKYYQVLQRYYVQYMAGYDADILNQLIQVSGSAVNTVQYHWSSTQWPTYRVAQ